MKKQLYFFGLIFLYCYHTNVFAAKEQNQVQDTYYRSPLIKELKNFKQIAEQAEKENKIILIEFSTPWCEYCEALENQVLNPMLLNKNYDDILIIGKVEINDYSTIIDFHGEKVIADAFSRKHKVNLYPTLVIFNSEGEELGNRIVGITTLDYVGQEIDRSIALAIKQGKNKD